MNIINLTCNIILILHQEKEKRKKIKTQSFKLFNLKKWKHFIDRMKFYFLID